MPGSATVTINDKQWAVDIAISESELAAGLGGLSSIPANTGMLFDLGSPQTVEVTTEPMLFNIDIIFISEGLEVVDVMEDVAPGYLVTEATPVRYFLEVNAGETEGIEAGDSVTITDYQYTPPSIINQWIPTIITIAMLGFVAAMVGGMARAALAPPKAVAVCSRCGARIYRTGEKYYDTPAGIFCYRCVPWPYKAPEYEKVCKSPGSPRRLSEPKTEAERKETHLRKYGTEEVPERGKGLEGHHSSSSSPEKPLEITPEEWKFAEVMWQSTKELKEKEDWGGTIIWNILEHHYHGDREKQTRLLGFMNDFLSEQKRRRPEGVPSDVMWSLARKWGVETMVVTEALRSLPGAQGLEEHHSMWLNPEQRKGLQEKYGAVAVRWAEEATRAGDIKGVETAAEYYYRKLKEVFGLGHLSPVLTEKQIRKLREVLGLTASATEVLKIHRETGYIP